MSGLADPEELPSSISCEVDGNEYRYMHPPGWTACSVVPARGSGHAGTHGGAETRRGDRVPQL